MHSTRDRAKGAAADRRHAWGVAPWPPSWTYPRLLACQRALARGCSRGMSAHLFIPWGRFWRARAGILRGLGIGVLLGAAPAHGLSLGEAVEQALESDPSLEAARLDEEAADAARRAIYGSWLPSVEFRQRFTRLDQATVDRANAMADALGSSGSTPDSSGMGPPGLPGGLLGVDFDETRIYRDSHRTEFEFNWALFTGGARLGARRLASGVRQLARVRRGAQMRRVVLGTRLAFLQAFQAAEVREVRASAVDQVAAYLRRTELEVRVGKATNLDQLRWQVELEAAHSDLAQAEVDEASARAGLERFLGRAVSDGEVLGKPEGGRDLPMLRESRKAVEVSGDFELAQASWLDRALGSAPSVVAAQANVEVASGAVRVAQAGRLPSVFARASYGWRANESIATDGYSDWNASLILSVPLLPYVTGHFEHAEARAHQAAETFRVEDARRQVIADVERAAARLRGAHRREVHAERARELAVEALASAQRSLAEGMLTRLELDDARLSLQNAELGAARARTAFLVEVVRLDFLAPQSTLDPTDSDAPGSAGSGETP